MMTISMPRKGDELTCTIESMAKGGMALARPGGVVVFIDRGLPGEEVRVRITESRRNHALAELVERLSDSPERVDAPCPHFERCGGCQWQELAYPSQIHWKRRAVVDSLSRVGGLGEEAEGLVEDIVPSPSEYGYRNKMEFSFAQAGSHLLLGLHERGSHRIGEPTDCMLMDEPEPGLAMAVLKQARELAGKSTLPGWSDRKGGFWRFLVLRYFRGQGGLAAHFITAPHKKGRRVVEAVAGRLLERCPGLSMVAHSTRSHPAQIAYGQGRARCWNRSGECESSQVERILGLDVAAPINGFMQVNTGAAERLFQTCIDWAAELESTPTLVRDLYCGCGGLTMGLARAFPGARVEGYEINREAVEAARSNATTNGLDNLRYITGDVLEKLGQNSSRADLVVVDPPRRGMDKELVQTLMEHPPRHILAISCDPATLARDIKGLSGRYALVKARPVDLFPQTGHVESIALLARQDG